MNPQTWTRLTRQTPLVKVFHYAEITSTSDRARAYLRRKRTPLTGPVLFAADRQTAGRGRGDHLWWSPDGGLFLSYAARRSDFGLDAGESVELSLAAAGAVARTLRRRAEKEKAFSVRVKHPNDVMLNGRKVCGILIESPTAETVIVGIGINLNKPPVPVPEEIRNRYISVGEVLGTFLDPLPFTAELTERLFS